jgi:putative FmdB family regulatory protein
MKKMKLVAAAVLAAVAVAIFVYELRPASGNPSRTYDYQCTHCQYQFRSLVKSGAEDLPFIECPKCKQIAAEKIMHYQCRKCWTKYDLRGSKATVANIVCPACGSRAHAILTIPYLGITSRLKAENHFRGINVWKVVEPLYLIISYEV